jgi:HSP20 family protein
MANLIRRTETPSETPAVWDPFRLMRDLMNWDPFAEMAPSLARAGETVFSPRFEVKETNNVYLFKADLPGIEEKDLEITLTGNRLTVSGKREAEAKDEGETYYAYERSYGSFSRSFTLPEGADADHAEADLRNGVLTLSIPKRPEHQPKKISLKGLGDKVKGVLGGKEKGAA